jgi:hypothetical protein
MFLFFWCLAIEIPSRCHPLPFRPAERARQRQGQRERMNGVQRPRLWRRGLGTAAEPPMKPNRFQSSRASGVGHGQSSFGLIIDGGDTYAAGAIFTAARCS